ncbi:BCCT transporter [Reichenbachiella sp. 5M10]|nr:BCCT transporter [Reichenbachiella sp. 5M10]
MTQINKVVFFPPIVLLLLTLAMSQLYPEIFVELLSNANVWVLRHFGWLFSWTAFAMVLLVFVIYVSPLGKWRIGGEDAQPFLTRWKWFAITTCTTIATGILFWGVAEPIFHLSAPPESLGMEPGSSEAMIFAMSALMMHWTLTPYSIYTLAGVVFALSFYNMKQPFSLGSMVSPLIGKELHPAWSNFIDVLCLYGLVAGMAASLGGGLLSLMGGLRHVLGIGESAGLLFVIAGAIVSTFILSAVSGLMRGIRILSDINIRGFIVLAVFVLVTEPTLQLLDLGAKGGWSYVLHMVPRSVNWSGQLSQSWFDDWTVFNWANWMAWTPITALFLGRLARGYTVREFIHFNLLFPALFSGTWMVIFGGSALLMDQSQGGVLTTSLYTLGSESLMYKILDDLPWSRLSSVLFVFLIFISYVTAADSNTSAMSALSTVGITSAQAEAPVRIKIIWGTLIGLVGWVMVSTVGVEGIRMTSILGGFPILFLLIAVGLAAVRMVVQSVCDRHS